MKYSTPVYIVAAGRSPIGRFGGALKNVSAVELAAQVAAGVVPPELRAQVGTVIFGQVVPAGVGMNLARQVSLRIGVPQTTPAWMVNITCGSGLKAVALGADAIAQGEADLVLAGGVEVMSQAPHYAPDARWGKKLGDAALVDSLLIDGLTDPTLHIGMGETAERIADQYHITREEQDRFALQSQQRAVAAAEAFRREIISVQAGRKTFDQDEHPRPETTLESLQQLKPAFRSNGTVTAGNASGINDGAAAVLLAGGPMMQQFGLAPRVRIAGCAVVGCDPALMGLGPVGAIRSLCGQLDWRLEEIEVVEINEAFAVQVLACARDLGLSMEQLNQRGGAIALGHPIGCSGARVLVTLLHLMEDKHCRRGIASLCIGGGMGIALGLELVS